MSSTTSDLRAVFLAAGFATRLYPLTKTCAKPLLEVGGEPMLTRLLRQVEATGRVRDVTVVTNGKFHADFVQWSEEVESSLPIRLVDDGVTDDTRNLGAIADLDLALQSMEGEAPSGWFVAAGDNLLDFELGGVFERFDRTGHAQLLTRRVPEPIPPKRYNEITLDGERVTAFREKPADPQTNLAAIAVYVLPPDLPRLVTDYLAEGGHPDAPGYLMEWLVTRTSVAASPLPGGWFDIGNAEDLAAARERLGS